MLDMVDALHARYAIDDALWSRLAETFAADQLVELVMLAGQYHGIAMLVNGLRIEHEAGAPRFPKT